MDFYAEWKGILAQCPFFIIFYGMGIIKLVADLTRVGFGLIILQRAKDEFQVIAMLLQINIAQSSHINR